MTVSRPLRLPSSQLHGADIRRMLSAKVLFRLADQTVELALFAWSVSLWRGYAALLAFVLSRSDEWTELIVVAALGVESMACARAQWR